MRPVELFWTIIHDTRGATAVEYGLIVAMIVMAMMASLQGFASATIDMWNDIEHRVQTK